MTTTSDTRTVCANATRLVIKVGSALATADGMGLDREHMAGWATQIAALVAAGREVIVVSSGAVAEGMARLGWKTRPGALHELQAAAAIGQMGLADAWESAFQAHGRHTAQVLITHGDLTDRTRYLNARSTLLTLLRLGVVPVINENDTVATDEIRFGDNDTLAAVVANLVDATVLVLLTDQDGLFDADPRKNPAAKLIASATVDDERLEAVAGEGGLLGRGGMVTKVRAARIAARSGTPTVIAGGRVPRVIERVGAGEPVGTFLLPTQPAKLARKRWLAGLKPQGRLILDDGASSVLKQSGRSLLAVGVISVEGEFERGAPVVCVDALGREIARGLVNYASADARRIMGQPSARIEAILGFQDGAELVHRDNLIVS
ncbi:MAG: glutamate 5-kinase [Chromatiales bacterium]|nr:glutamate 5-kinase [Chromatiales bacterium]